MNNETKKREKRKERKREKLKKWLRMVEDELPGSGAENLILRCFDTVGDRKGLSKDLEPY